MDEVFVLVLLTDEKFEVTILHVVEDTGETSIWRSTSARTVGLNQAVVKKSSKSLSKFSMSNLDRLFFLDLIICFLVNCNRIEEVKLSWVWWNYINLYRITQLIYFKSKPLWLIFISVFFVWNSKNLHAQSRNISWEY